ncbi:HlyD family secretion protein [Pseudobacter ginsenosidimutans]|uniref:HlyD family secretion protein n=1 Tax=Pseudobacter ginsenosidimutans TaxID=661488 RepID=A0A4Q7MKA0_9BACT|nr:HlyD family efflux transporter periplasmic adaptor subunit [Pseudobacter ginsenosidimutans]QEC45468.1 HlyD family efflux transporter periplasmic adaptor subunit [Pseudobacter ginsenosidimutans]RZS66999.1 HlyD family secretion protein [Pseudobacter ginsenosidimutans]
MKQFLLPVWILIAGLFAACNGKDSISDATGTFEVDEVIVSSELTGKILSFNVQEGDSISKDKVVGVVDAENINLQKEQVQASIEALSQRTADLAPQVKLLEDQLKVQESQMENLLHEKARLENLIKADAATAKQMDDMNAQIDVVKKQMQVTRQQIQVQRSNIGTQNRSILSEKKPLAKRVAQLDDQLKRANITNPVQGTVIEKYAEEGEMTATGKALYKIADLSVMTLRAYVTGIQLPQIKLGQSVKVLIDDGAKKYRELTGTITWISDKAEFTPKTIQTKEERANLVYAIKVKVKNDGYLKIGMYGEIKF